MEQFYDVIIVGGGPAGLSAAIYMARARYKVLVMEKEKIGGQITITAEIVNYPGVERTSGKELTQSMKEQAEAFGLLWLKFLTWSFRRISRCFTRRRESTGPLA